MALIIILIGLLVEHFVGVSDDIRRLDWFNQYVHWLENRLTQYKVWNGAAGVIITLSGPLLIILLIDYVLLSLFMPLSLLFALAVLLYSLGPKYLNPQLDDYIHALEAGDEMQADELALEFLNRDDTHQRNEQAIIENILIQANERLFGIIFWLLILGPFGALLYRLASLLRLEQLDIHGSYPDASRDLYNILNWPTARLLALGNALSGHLVDAFEAWGKNEKNSLQLNEVVIKASGLGALQYRPQSSNADDTLAEDSGYWFRMVQGLLNRTLIVWLIVLGLMTLAGWLG
ncbi:MAG: regulatory signaling modulator protein AmpE [Gammaproteobacteria bacterium]